jgi:hypothetical protein
MMNERDIEIIKERIKTAQICKCGTCICCVVAQEWQIEGNSIIRTKKFKGFGMGDDNGNN